jgi:DNA-binding transcriptional regulator YiaG
MSKGHRERLERAGWKVGSTADFLELTEVEAALVEAKVTLGDAVRVLRRRGRLSQSDLARRMGSSQSRVAKVESHAPEVSLDLQLRAVFAAHPSARKDFQGLVRKWSGGAALAASEPARPRRQ